MACNFQCVRIIGKTICQYSIYIWSIVCCYFFHFDFLWCDVAYLIYDRLALVFSSFLLISSIFCDQIWMNLWSWWNLHRNTNNRNVEIKVIIMRTLVFWCFRASLPQNTNTYGIAYFLMPTLYTTYIVSWFFTSVFIQCFLHFQF